MAIDVFAYWHDTDLSVLAPFIEHWHQHFPQFHVLGDGDVVPLINRYLPEAAPLYSRLQLPTAKADLARLVALYVHGGLYVDCKCVIRDQLELRRLIDQLENVECILVDLAPSTRSPRGLPGFYRLINAILLARPGCELLRRAAQRTAKNLQWQYSAECQHGYIEYNLSELTGSDILGNVLFEPGSLNREICPEFSKILIVPEEKMPIGRDHFSYRSPAMRSSHWSERQKRERLFA
jgi:glycosyl transferase-like sugar-binding protein